MEYDCIFKILIIGDSGVGKSSILLRYTDNYFLHHYESTIGIDFKIKILNINNKKIKLQLWDTAGQERFRNITKSYYKNTHGILLVYDVTNMISLHNLNKWLKEIDEYTKNHDKIPIILIGNKKDNDNEEIDINYINSYINNNIICDNNISKKCIYCSAKDGSNINKIFTLLVNEIFKNIDDTNTRTNNSNENLLFGHSINKNDNMKSHCINQSCNLS